MNVPRLPAPEMTAPPAAEPDAVALRGLPGYAMVVEGADHDDAPAVAVWHASSAGEPAGAWITPVSALAQDPAAAHRLLRLTHHRALFGWDVTDALRLRQRIAEWAGQPVGEAPITVLLPDLLAEIAEHRRACDRAVDQYREQANRKVDPIDWRRPVPQANTWAEFTAAARLPLPLVTCGIAQTAVHLVRGLRWAVELWRETEVVRGRRRYLTDQFGPAAALPPDWLRRLQAVRLAEANGDDGTPACTR